MEAQPFLRLGLLLVLNDVDLCIVGDETRDEKDDCGSVKRPTVQKPWASLM
jgi:hypothetical protein